MNSNLKYILLVAWLVFGVLFPYKTNAIKPVFIEGPVYGSNLVKASLIVDAKTKKLLHYHNVYTKIYPASLTKMMTIYVALDEIKKGNLSFNTKLKVSEKAANIEPAKLWLKAGSTISVKDAISAMIVTSANDAAVVLSEHIGQGDESKFAKIMTGRAHQLGMRDTVFKNSSGLPDKDQVSTAMDMARLALALDRDFKNHYSLFGQTYFTYLGKKYYTINKVTAKYKSVTGIKTGYTRASGFNLVTSAERDGNKLVGVVIGYNSSLSRNKGMVSLITKYLNRKSTIIPRKSSKVKARNKVQKKN